MQNALKSEKIKQITGGKYTVFMRCSWIVFVTLPTLLCLIMWSAKSPVMIIPTGIQVSKHDVDYLELIVPNSDFNKINMSDPIKFTFVIYPSKKLVPIIGSIKQITLIPTNKTCVLKIYVADGVLTMLKTQGLIQNSKVMISQNTNMLNLLYSFYFKRNIIFSNRKA